MDVILLERIARLGQMGDTVKVRDGYARNYLLPTGRALRANEANRAKFESQKTQLVQRNEERKSEAQEIAKTLEGRSFVAVRSAGETGQLYGSVSTRDIAELLAADGFKVGRNEIELRLPIKAIGVHAISIALHPEVSVSINVNVARSPDEAERQSRGEDLTSADAIYGIDEEELEDEDEGAEDEAGEEEGVETPSAESEDDQR